MVLLYDNVGNSRLFMSLFQSFKKLMLSSIIMTCLILGVTFNKYKNIKLLIIRCIKVIFVEIIF